MSASSERLFERVFARADHPIFVLDPARDRIRYANRCACALLGYEVGELLAMPITSLCGAEVPKLGAFLRAIDQRGDGWTISLALRTKAGAFMPAEVLALCFVIDEHLYVLMLAHDRSQHRGRPA